MSGRRAHFEQKRKDHELTVFTKSQELIEYSLNITEKFPKKERFVITSRIQNTALEIYENLINANETFIDLKTLRDMKKTIKVLENRRKNDEKEKNEEYFFRENKLFMLRVNFSNKYDERINERRSYQNKALTNAKKLAFFIRLSFQKRYISEKQYEYWSLMTDEVKRMIAGWINSDRERYQY
jgi:hypothetical protein